MVGVCHVLYLFFFTVLLFKCELCEGSQITVHIISHRMITLNIV